MLKRDPVSVIAGAGLFAGVVSWPNSCPWISQERASGSNLNGGVLGEIAFQDRIHS
jgi:hypothetical protein